MKPLPDSNRRVIELLRKYMPEDRDISENDLGEIAADILTFGHLIAPMSVRKREREKQAAPELQKLHLLATALARHIERVMDKTSLDAIKKADPTLLVQHLHATAAAAREAVVQRKPGQPKKILALLRAENAKEAFKTITGGEAKGKKFKRFVADVYKTLGETANVDRQVKNIRTE